MQLHREAGTLEATLAWEHSRHSFALQAACSYNNPDAVAVLIEAGVDVNRVNSCKGSTALMTAVGQGQKACVILLLAVPGIQVNVKDKNGKTALGRAQTKTMSDLLIAAGGTL